MRERSVFPWKFGGCQQIWLQLVEVKGVPINCKNMLLTFWKVKDCKGGREGSSTVGGPKAATNKSSSKNRKKQQQLYKQQQQAQAAAKAAAAARPQQEHKQQEEAATSSRIRSSTKQAQTTTQKKGGPRGVGPEGGTASSRGISVVFEFFFSGYKQNL